MGYPLAKSNDWSGFWSVRCWLRIYDNGKFIINVMDPGGSGTSFTSLKTILYLLTVFPK